MWFYQFFVTWQRFFFRTLRNVLLWLFLDKFFGGTFSAFKRFESNVILDFYVIALGNFIYGFILYRFYKRFIQSFAQCFNMFTWQTRLVWNSVTLPGNIHFQLKSLILLICLVVNYFKSQLFIVCRSVWWAILRIDRVMVKWCISNFKFFIIEIV